jgi:hypothetical protein
MTRVPATPPTDTDDAARLSEEAARHQQDDLDEALDESFPASDPPSPYIPERTRR